MEEKVKVSTVLPRLFSGSSVESTVRPSSHCACEYLVSYTHLPVSGICKAHGPREGEEWAKAINFITGECMD